MGLFDWLFGKRGPRHVAVRDLIWQTVAAKTTGVGAEVGAEVAAGRPVLLLAHFPATLAAVGQELTGRKLACDAIPDGLASADAVRLAAGGPRVLFGLARQLRPDEFPPGGEVPAGPLAVFVLERHFLRSRDDEITRFAAGLGRTTVVFHTSLEDPLMRLFAGDWVAVTLRNLGMKEDEVLESGLVARRLKAAQDKVAAKAVTGDEERPADSPEEWLAANFGRTG